MKKRNHYNHLILSIHVGLKEKPYVLPQKLPNIDDISALWCCKSYLTMTVYPELATTSFMLPVLFVQRYQPVHVKATTSVNLNPFHL